MKKIMMGFFIIITSVSAIAQPAGDTWHYMYGDMAFIGYLKAENDGDTLIAGKNFFKWKETIYVQSMIDFQTDSGYFDTKYIRWEQDTVFQWTGNQEFELFNFTLQAGDTLKMRLRDIYGTYCDSVGRMLVDSTGTMMIGGVNKQWISVTPLQNEVVGMHGKIVDGVGPVEGYFFPQYIGCIADAAYGGSFRCLSLGDSLIYKAPGSYPCDYINSIEEHLESLSIFPNPVDDHLQISVPASTENQVFIADAAGRIVLSCSSSDSNILLYVGNLQPGLYFITIQGIHNFSNSFYKN